VLGTPACRFHNPALANAITGLGRELLLWSKEWFENAGFKVLYGDTDSLFVDSGSDDGVQAREQGVKLAVALNDELSRYVSKRWNVTSRLELEFEKLYLQLFLPKVRRGSGGARKRYAGLLDRGDADNIEFVGMEVVRRDWTDLAKQVQRELYHRLFRNLPVAEYLAEIVKKSARWPIGRFTRLSQERAQGYGRLHRIHAAPRCRCAQVDSTVTKVSQLPRHHGRTRADRQRASPHRSGALRREANQACCRADPGDPRTQFRWCNRGQPPT